MAKKSKKVEEQLTEAVEEVTGEAVTKKVAAPKPKVESVALRDIQLPEKWNRDKLADIPALAQSIKAEGQLVPLVIRIDEEGRYELVDGRRRYAALAEAGIAKAAVVYTDADSKGAYLKSLAANLARTEHTPLELSRTFAELKASGYKIKEIAASVAWKDSRVGQYIKLQSLPEEALQMLAQEKIGFSMARALCALDYQDPKDLKFFGKVIRILEEGTVQVYKLEEAIASYLDKKAATAEVTDADGKKKKKKGRKASASAKETVYDYEDEAYVASMSPRAPAMIGAYLNDLQERRQNARTRKQKEYTDAFIEGVQWCAGLLED